MTREVKIQSLAHLMLKWDLHLSQTVYQQCTLGKLVRRLSMGFRLVSCGGLCHQPRVFFKCTFFISIFLLKNGFKVASVCQSIGMLWFFHKHMPGKKIILENSKQQARMAWGMQDWMRNIPRVERSMWQFCTAHPSVIKYPKVPWSMPTTLGREYFLFLWISALVKDKATIHRISGGNVKLYAMEFIVIIYSQ